MPKFAPTNSYTVTRWQHGQSSQAEDQLAEEVPVALVYNGVSHAVMLATPQDLEDFALGFSLTEGILHNKQQLYGVEVVEQADGIELQLEIATEQFVKLKEKRRNLAGRTGCGLCGAESLTQVFHLPDENDAQQQHTVLSRQSLLKAHDAMREKQHLQSVTGATHACAWANAQGDIVHLREDIGRHNALDKLIGVLHQLDVTGGFIITSSRASYEMVQKIVMAGFDILAAISAPTGLAVRIADTYHVTLLGFVRDQQYVAYSHQNRITE